MTIVYYKVGGCVRDYLLGVKSKDIDYAVVAPSYEAMRDDIISKGATIYVEKPEYLTIRAKMGKDDADFVLCRKDGAYSDGRRPDDVTPGTILDDLRRRDFTMNAIAEGPDGLYDPFGGMKDISEKKIKCVGKAEDRFGEDPLRLLRALRFSITKSFQLDQSVRSCMNDPTLCSKLNTVSLERVREELNKCFAHSTAYTLEALSCYDELSFNIFEARPGLSLEATLRER